jgi:hypothetical protein
MNIYFIGGASGSGKTAIMPYLKELLDEDISLYDFDAIGVPEGADKKWRQESTEKWLQKILHDSKNVCLFGGSVLGEILACPSARQLNKINFCLLDVSDFERIQRLKKRNTYGVDQHMLNWAAWLRMHLQDPQWMQHVIQDDCWGKMDWVCLRQLEKWDEKANVNIIDTTDLTLNEVTARVVDWIKSIKYPKAIIYVPNTNYTLHLNDLNAFKIVDQKLFEFNKHCVPPTQVPEVINKHVIIKNGDKLIAGICGDIYIWKILYISVVFVEEKHRHQGLGSLLLDKVEEEAKVFGATLAHLDTFDFQAKDFYLKHGYEVFGILDNCPKGHKRYYMKKVFI